MLRLDRRSNSRRRIDELLTQWEREFKGVVIEIGGVRRGRARPSPEAERWFIADIVPIDGVDVVLDICNMSCIRDNALGAIKANEVLEHVLDPAAALACCDRALKPGGFLFLTVPFMHKVHADPTDFQRWTADKWRIELNKTSFAIERFEILGSFFSLLGEMGKAFLVTLPRLMRRPAMIVGYPMFNWIARLDGTAWLSRRHSLSNYHTGYFFALRKPDDRESDASRATDVTS